MVDDVYNTDPRPLTRNELAKFLPSQRAVRAFEKLFNLVPQDFVDQQEAIDALDLLAGMAESKSQQALDTINRLSEAVELLALAHYGTTEELPDDLAPVGVQPETEADDLAPIANVSSIEGEISDITTQLIRSSETLNDGAGGATGTLTNAPAAGDPTKWVPIDDNGTTLYLPAW